MSTYEHETKTTVLRALADQSPLHVTDLAETVDDHPVTIDRMCSRLQEQGLVSALGRGLYEATDAGERRADPTRD